MLSGASRRAAKGRLPCSLTASFCIRRQAWRAASISFAVMGLREVTSVTEVEGGAAGTSSDVVNLGLAKEG